MRLVDGERFHSPFAELGEKIRQHEPLRREVKQAVFAGVEFGEALFRLPGIQRGVEERRRHAAGGELINLILHQRDERRDNHGEPVPHHSRQLVTQALAGTGGQHGQRVAAGEKRLRDFALMRTESVVAEDFFQLLFQRGHGRECLRGGRDRQATSILPQRIAESSQRALALMLHTSFIVRLSPYRSRSHTQALSTWPNRCFDASTGHQEWHVDEEIAAAGCWSGRCCRSGAGSLQGRYWCPATAHKSHRWCSNYRQGRCYLGQPP